MFAFDEKEKSPRIQQFNQQEKQCIDTLLVASKLKQEEKQIAYAKHFEGLGDIFAQRGELLQDTRQQLKAVALYNLVLASQLPLHQSDRLYEDKLIPFSILNETQRRLIGKVKEINDKFIHSCGGHVPKQNLEDYWQKIEEAKGILRTIRQRAQNELVLVEKEEIAVQAIYQHIADGLKEKLIKAFINRCFDCLSIPEGCIYSILALGSLAQEETTPFSDFEFAILIQDQSEGRNKIHKEYFRKFTHLLWIEVLNLRETTIRMMDITFLDWMPEQERLHYQSKLIAIDWLVESTSPAKKGFSFDGQMEGGCHTPLGNRHYTLSRIREIERNQNLSRNEKKDQIKRIGESEYELIGTPEELSLFQIDEWFKRKNALSIVLSTILVINGNDNGQLVESYTAKVKKILNETLNSNNRWTRIQKRSLSLLKESCEKFKFQGGRFEKECHYFDAKYHLYRLPNMLIDHLAAYFGVSKRSLWERIDNLFGQGGKIPNESIMLNLIEVASIILKLRLQSYLKKGHRDDHIILFEIKQPQKNKELLLKYLGIDQKLLFHIYTILIQLQWSVEEFVEQKGQKKILLKYRIDNQSLFAYGWINNLLLNYKKAAKAYEIEKKLVIDTYGKNHPYIADIIVNLGEVYIAQDEPVKAQAAFLEAIKIKEANYGNNHIYISEAWRNLGIAYEAQGKFKDAELAYKNAIKIAKKHSIQRAYILNSLGHLYRANANYDQSMAAYVEANRIKLAAYGRNHISVATTLNNIGLVYHDKGEYDKAIETLEESKRIHISIYGNSHILVAGILNNLGLAYRSQGYFAKAIEVYEEAKYIYLLMLGKKHTFVAIAWHNIGLVYQEQGHYQMAITAYKEAKDNFISMHGKNHISLAATLTALGSLYYAQFQYKKALKNLKKAKQIRIQSHREDHPLVAETLNIFGSIYIEQGRYKKALAALEKVKKVRVDVYGKDHILVAETLNILGNFYICQANYQEAVSTFDEAKKIYITKCEQSHVQVANTYNNLGNAYIELRQFDQARICFKQAIENYEKANHPNKKIAEENMKFSFLREANYFIINNNMKLANEILRKEGLTLNFTQIDMYYHYANLFYDRNYFSAAYECYKIIIEIDSHDAFAYQMLGRLTYRIAKIDEDNSDKVNYLAYLKEANNYFLKALELNSHTEICTEYVQFVLRNYPNYFLEVIASLLIKAIERKGKNEELSYRIMERPTLDYVLQRLIDCENKISIKAYLLAHYLLIQSYLLNHQIKEANQTLNSFKLEVAKCNEDNKKRKAIISSQRLPEYSDEFQSLQAQEKEIRLLAVLLRISKQIMHLISITNVENILTFQGVQYITLGPDTWIAKTSDGEKHFVFQNKVVSFKVYIYGYYTYCIAHLLNGHVLEAQQMLSSLQNEALQFKEAARKRKQILKLRVLPNEVQQILQKIVKVEKEERELIEMVLEASLPSEEKEKPKPASSSISSAFSSFTQDVNPPVFKSSEGIEKRSETSEERKQKIPLAEPGFISTFLQPHIQREGLHAEYQVKAWLVGKVPSQLRLGKAISKGDCFFDAVAQGLNQLSGKEEYNTKSLRLLCDEYAKDTTNNWIREANKRDREDHEQYLVRIQFTAQEIEEKERQGIKLGTAVWGRPKIEGRIFCEQFNIRLHVIEIQGEGSIHRYLVDREGEKEEVNPQVDYNDLRVIHLVNYHNHYVPLLQSSGFTTQLQEEVMQKQPTLPKQGEATKVPRSLVHANHFGTQAPYCHVNSAIVGKIFRFFDTSTLRTVKLVNKQWYEAVQELEKRNDIKRLN